MDYITIEINKSDYQLCVEASKNMWSSSKPGMYGRGLLNNEKDPYRTERLGRLGEKALSIYLGKDVNFEYVKGGDSGDLIAKKKIDIKTASYNYGALLIQAQNEYGKNIKLKADYYVAALCEKDDIEGETSLIKLIGWCDKQYVSSLPMVPARRGKHKNYDIRYDELRNVEELKEVFE